MARRFVTLTGAAIVLFVVCVIAHNAVSAIFQVEEAFFFLVAIFVAPLMLGVGVTGALVTGWIEWRHRRSS
jgi:hypothetical protein